MGLGLRAMLVVGSVLTGACGGAADDASPEAAPPTRSLVASEPPPAPPTLPPPPAHLGLVEGPAQIGILASSSAHDFDACAGRLRQVMGPEATIARVHPSASFAGYRVVVLVSGWAQHDFDLIQRASQALTVHVENGGGILVFQPNPFNFPGERMTLDILPGHLEIENRYDDPSVLITAEHPVVDGLDASEMPYPADRITAADTPWQILARGSMSHAGSLAVTDRIGRGRAAVDTDHPGLADRSERPTQSDRFLRRLIDWLANAR